MGDARMKPSEITLLHTDLKRQIKEILHFSNLTIKQPQGHGDWRKATFGSHVGFEMLYDGTYQEQTAQRDKGGRCSVFALHPNDADGELTGRYWVGWFEEWQVQAARQDFVLRTAAWSVFAGPPNQQKQQIIRAEWDQIPITGRALSGQPHWHVDRFPPIQTAVYEPAPVVAPVETNLLLACGANGASELGYLHLAMGAWNGQQGHPECWQRWAKKPEDVVTWGVRTLQYLQSEFRGQL